MTAKLFYLPFPTAFNSNGLPAPGAKVYFYLSGTSTLALVYTDAGLSIPHQNPVVANGAGRLPSTYLDSNVTYRLRITDSTGALLDDIDPLVPGNIVGNISGPTGPIGPAGSVTISGVTFVTVKQFGALGDGSTDDTAAIQAAIAAVTASGGPKLLLFPTPAAGAFYKCDGQLDFSLTTGITLKGEGNRIEPTTDTAPCALVYTGTVASFLKLGKSHSLTIKGLAIQYSSASFTGDIVTLDHDGSVRPTYSTKFEDCMFGGRTSAARHARSCINLTGAVEAFVDSCTFGWADQQIIGRASDSLLTYSNAVTITRNRFSKANNHAVNKYGASQWSIRSNVFEPRFDGAAGGISDLLVGGTDRTSSGGGVVIAGNGFWDATTGTWIDISAFGDTIAGNYTELGGGTTFVKFNGGVGVLLSGNRIVGSAGAKFIDNAGSTVSGFADDKTNLVDGAVTYNANAASFAPISRTFLDNAVRTLTATGDLGGVGGFLHARKAVGSGAVGGGLILDRNDDTNWRGAALFSYLDPTLVKDCLAFAVSDSTTSPLTASKIVALLTEDGDLQLVRKLLLAATITAGGTTGAQTINKASGAVNFAAAASSLVVTNSLVSATSLIICTVMTNDGTLKSVQAVPGAGSFTLYGNAAATAETKVGFLVVN